MPQLIRAEALNGFDELVLALGGDANALLVAAGLSPHVAHSPGHYIAHRGFTRLLELAARDLACADFGLRLGVAQSLSALGPIALALESAETLAEVFVLVERYIHIHDQSVITAHHPLKQQTNKSGDYLFSIDLRVRGATTVTQNRELAVGLAYETFTRLSEGAWQPKEVWFSHTPISDATSYQRYFHCPVHFQQAASGLVMAAEALHLPLSGHDAGRAALIGSYLRAEFGAGNSSVTSQVESLIRPLLGVERCTHTHVAQLLAMHPRTLHRRLRLEGTSFAEIKETQRQRWARELLAQGLAAGRIASLLGYGHDSAFTRACQRWFGQGPRVLKVARQKNRPVAY